MSFQDRSLHPIPCKALRTGDPVGQFQLMVPLASARLESWLASGPSETRVVLKTPASKYRNDPVVMARFQNEALLAQFLRHPNIVELVEVFEWRGRSFLALRWLGSGSLADHIGTHGPFDVDRTVQIAVPLLAALAFIHDHGVTHRDIKPGNILFDGTGAPHIAELGRALVSLRAGTVHAEAVLGTSDYASPEQAFDGAPGNRAADLYSFGVTLFEMLTGRPPGHRNDQLPRPSSFNPRITPAVDAAVLKSLQRDPAARYRNAREMSRSLVAAAAGESWIRQLGSKAETMRKFFAGFRSGPRG